MFSWSHDRAEIIADGIIHAIGIALGVAGAAFLLLSAFHTARDGEIASVIIYVVGLLSMLGVSAAYNSWPVSPHKWMLRRFSGWVRGDCLDLFLFRFLRLSVALLLAFSHANLSLG